LENISLRWTATGAFASNRSVINEIKICRNIGKQSILLWITVKEEFLPFCGESLLQIAPSKPYTITATQINTICLIVDGPLRPVRQNADQKAELRASRAQSAGFKWKPNLNDLFPCGDGVEKEFYFSFNMRVCFYCN